MMFHCVAIPHFVVVFISGGISQVLLSVALVYSAAVNVVDKYLFKWRISTPFKMYLELEFLNQKTILCLMF